MFSNSFQSGFISIFYSVGSNPLSLWDKQVKNGHIRRVIDDEVKSLVLEISGTNVATTYITSPIKPRASLGIKLPFLVMIIKNMKKYFTFEIQILDDKDMHRRFRVSNFQSTTKVRPFCTTMPIGLSSGWNQVQFNLADFTKRAYGSTYLETMRVQVHANVRIRRLYFTDTLYSDEDMPNEFKLFGPVTQKKKSDQKSSKDQEKDQPPKTDEKADEEIPPPPSPAEPAPEKETLETEVIDEQAHPSEVGEAPPEGSVEPAEQETVEGEAEKDKEVPPEGEETLQKDEATEEIKITEQQEVTEEVSVVVETEEKHIEETTEEMPPAEGAAPTEDAPPTEEAPPIEEAPTEEPSPTEEPAPTEEPPSTDQPPTTQEPEAAAAVDPGTTEPASEVTTAEPAVSDIATTEPTVDEPTTSELPTESENESPEE